MIEPIILVLLIHVGGLHGSNTTDQTSRKVHKRAPGSCPTTAATILTAGIANNNAFSSNFDVCMIDQWITAGVLKSSPTASCNTRKHSRLCYGIAARRPHDAQYIACYNTARLIPDFTAYVVPHIPPPITSYTRPNRFKQDTGPCAPNPQSAHGDCSKPTTATGNYFCSRGHLTPCGAFNTKDERDLTFTMVNVAPQWQEFNAQNWAAVENGVKKYVQAKSRGVYVFTGTAGISKYWQWGFRWTYTVPTVKTVVPKYFWKAVCDPAVKESIFFIAENNVEVRSTTTVTSASCFGMKMTEERGVIQCESISEAAGRCIRNWWHGISVPDFDSVNCGTGAKGNFLQPYLKFT